jgi:transglutaminase-like putative cysteine protease
MPRWALLVGILALTAGFASAAEPLGAPQPAGKLVREQWEVAYLDGFRAGFVRFTVREVAGPDGQPVLSATKDLYLTLKRFGQAIAIQAQTGSVETAGGQVLAVSMRQGLAKQQQLVMTGTVEDGKQLRLKVAGPMTLDKVLPWDKTAIGLIGENQFLNTKQAKPGEQLQYRMFEPTIAAAVTVQVRVAALESVTVEGLGKRNLVRAEAEPNEIQGVQLPASTLWFDPMTRDVLLTRVELPGLGTLTLVRSDKPVDAPATPPNVDLALGQSIRLNARLANVHQQGPITYRITMSNDRKLEKSKGFAEDPRQQVTNFLAEQRRYDMVVTPRRQPPAVAPAEAMSPGEEFTVSNYFINSADKLVQAHAQKAKISVPIAEQADPWKLAQACERWVHTNMRVLNFSEAMATADHVARTLEGDCTEFAMLTAALCRVLGVPARTALGLVYFEKGKDPMLGYHMWTEVWVRGEWVAIDATLGLGHIGPGHLKITDHSWHDTRTLTPIFPVLRVLMGKPEIQIVPPGR